MCHMSHVLVFSVSLNYLTLLGDTVVLLSLNWDLLHFSITSFKIQQEPAIAEVEVGVVTVLMHQLKELGVQDLQRWTNGIQKM